MVESDRIVVDGVQRRRCHIWRRVIASSHMSACNGAVPDGGKCGVVEASGMLFVNNRGLEFRKQDGVGNSAEYATKQQDGEGGLIIR